MKHKTQGFLDARKRLQILHRQRQSTNRDSPDRSWDNDGVDQTLEDLVDYIENNECDDTCESSCADPRKAAKKARQKERKHLQMQEKQRKDDQFGQCAGEASKQPTPNGFVGSHGQTPQTYPGYPNVPYSNGHQPQMPWMYGYPPGSMPMHPSVPPSYPPQMPYGMNYQMPGYPPVRHPPPNQNYGYPGAPYGGQDWNQQPQNPPPSYGPSNHQQPRPSSFSSQSPTPPPAPNFGASKSGTVAGLMEGFIKKQGNESTAASESKMVTIRRVMEPHSSDPTVTISMKGETPEQDKLMFTLVNGQVIPSSDVIRNGMTMQDNFQPNESSEAKKKKRRKKKKKTACAEAAEPEVSESFEQFQHASEPVEKPREEKLEPSPVFEPEVAPSPPPSPVERRRDESPGADSVSLSSLTSRSPTPKPTEELECEGPLERDPTPEAMESEPAVSNPINVVVESEEDESFVDAKEHLSPRSDANHSVESRNDASVLFEAAVEELTDTLQSALLVSEPEIDDAVSSEGNAVSSLPDILENGDKLDCIAARIDQLQQMIKASEEAPEAAPPVVKNEDSEGVSRELMETNKTLEALAHKIRTLKQNNQNPQKVQNHLPQQRCDTCSDCSSGPRGAPVSRLKQKLLSKRSAAAKKEEQQASKAPVESERRRGAGNVADSEDDQGEELLKNLKLPPDITITRVKSADGKRSYNFRRQNASLSPNEPVQKPPARTFQPSAPDSISISPISAAQSSSAAASSTASAIANAAAAAAAADSSWNKNVIVVDSQKEEMSAGGSYGPPSGFGNGMPMGFGGPAMGRPGMHPPPPVHQQPPMNHVNQPPYWNNMYGFNGPQMPPMPNMGAPQPYGMPPAGMFPPRFPQPTAPPPPFSHAAPPPLPPPQQKAKEQKPQVEQPLNKKARRKLKRAAQRAAVEEQQHQPPTQPVPPSPGPPPMWPPPHVPGWVYIPAPPPLPAGVIPNNNAGGGNKDGSPPPGQPAYPYYYQYVDPNTNAVVYYVVGATVPSAVPPPPQQQHQPVAEPKQTQGGKKAEKAVEKPKETTKVVVGQKPTATSQKQQGKKGKNGKIEQQPQLQKKQQRDAKTASKVDSDHPLSQFYSAAHDVSGPRVPSPMSDALHVSSCGHQHGMKQEVSNGADGGGKKKNKKKKNKASGKSDEIGPCDSVFVPKNVDLEDETLDETEKELEAFKRFCFASVPLDRKEKVNLNIRDIIMKKQRAGDNSGPVPSSGGGRGRVN